VIYNAIQQVLGVIQARADQLSHQTQTPEEMKTMT
jgi:hypothetical protein